MTLVCSHNSISAKQVFTFGPLLYSCFHVRCRPIQLSPARPGLALGSCAAQLRVLLSRAAPIILISGYSTCSKVCVSSISGWCRYSDLCSQGLQRDRAVSASGNTASIHQRGTQPNSASGARLGAVTLATVVHLGLRLAERS